SPDPTNYGDTISDNPNATNRVIGTGTAGGGVFAGRDCTNSSDPVLRWQCLRDHSLDPGEGVAELNGPSPTLGSAALAGAAATNQGTPAGAPNAGNRVGTTSTNRATTARNTNAATMSNTKAATSTRVTLGDNDGDEGTLNGRVRNGRITLPPGTHLDS